MSERTSVEWVGGMMAAWSNLHERRWVYWVPVVAYALLIFALSSLPNPTRELPSVFGQFNDKVVHIVEYGILAILLYRGFRWGAGPSWATRALWSAVLGAVLYGISDEIHQSFVPPREADVLDVMADTVGAMGFTLLWRRYAESGWAADQRQSRARPSSEAGRRRP